MKLYPEEKTLEKIFTGISTRYFVPEYQRDYMWKRENVEELWNDLLISFHNSSEYFMGPIVLNTENLEEDTYEIIDGQQRLTTFVVLFSVVRAISSHFLLHPDDPIFEMDSTDENKKLAQRIKDISDDKLVHRSEPDNYYLKINKKDNDLFESEIQKSFIPIFGDDEIKVNATDKRLIKTKKIFTKEIIDRFLGERDGLESLYNFLIHVSKKLKFLEIGVESDQDAYLLFESLNSKGLDLSIADLLKNRMLMVCSTNSELKETVYRRWENMIETLEESRYSPTDFIRFYWIAYERQVTNKELYRSIKENLNLSTVDKYSSSFLEKAEFFSKITNKNLKFPTTEFSPRSIEWCFSELNTLGYSVCYPLFIRLHFDRPELLGKVVSKTISYLFRLVSIGDFSAGKAEGAFNKALSYLKEGKSDDEILGLFDDDEIKDAIFKERFFTKQYDNNLAKYILIKMDLYNNGDSVIPNRQVVHLEHILPINPSQWVDFDRKDQDCTSWIRNIGNMTLLDDNLNKSISNKIFSEKVSSYKERSNNEGIGTRIPMTYEIFNEYESGKTEWTAERIKERAKKFSDDAVRIWSI